MPLSEHVPYEKILADLQDNSPGYSQRFRRQSIVDNGLVSDVPKDNSNTSIFNPYESFYSINPIAKFHVPKSGANGQTVAQLIRDDLDLDGKPALNLASFVNTFIDPVAQQLAVENLTKNMSDSDEYPALMNIHQRCISMISHLWHVPEGNAAIGTCTTGSSEAIHLGGLAMKRRWEARQKANGRPFDRPNILMGANAQVALEKFARYFDVEPRIIPVSDKSRNMLDLEKIYENLDENTIGIFVILGSTYTGSYEDVEGVSKILDKYQEDTGIDIPIHVDGASGGLVAPFVHPHVKWDFSLPRVKSINTSGHKFGLTTAGLGWVIWSDTKYLPDNLIFLLKYLGGNEKSYTLNFSRPGHTVVHQYYNFLTLGYEGYKRVHSASLYNARLFSKFLESTGYFQCVSEIHRLNGDYVFDPTKEHELTKTRDASLFNPGLPVVAFMLTDEFKQKYPEVPQAAISTLLRVKGYIIPNYPLPVNNEAKEVLRVVVRYTITLDLLDNLMEDIVQVVQTLISSARSLREDPDVPVDDGHRKGIYKALLALVSNPNVQEEHENEWKHLHRGASIC
ncbi:uncharacterized protein SAPINGB_P003243 [Magnusiomyces paraingens]|uniref:Glutamate decarboxylase n=1 Tax=Magnusiomyces paraingens TaxID=2606893 RepID=A0A5E8BJM4_9ASCO|nr:uncharacterized protein SAPINGB_P003243 [Saprochaete ingens]VVT51878.1 unnamed protein product [Saprochaete ingens]